jgi:signal transduction histidine kinase
MGVRLRATLAATLTVAVALGLATAALFAALHASLQASAHDEAARNAKVAAASLDPCPVGSAGIPGSGAAPPKAGPVTCSVAGAPQVAGAPGAAGPAGVAAPGAAGPAGVAAPGTAPLVGDAQLVGTASGAVPWQDGAGYTVVNQPVAIGPGKLIVQGRASLEPARRALDTLRNLLIPGGPALLALVAVLTWTALGRALRPVAAIRAKVADITAHDLHQRVPEPDSRDEIAALARTVNATLDRLQTAVEAHRQFVADAAHELRSPLTILRTRLELAGPEAGALATESLTDVARLQSLTTDLLLLARLDAGEPQPDEQVDLAQVAADEAVRTRPRGDVRVNLDLAQDLLVLGSAERLRRLVANLLDNAVRHAAAAVDVRLSARPGRAVLEVIDDGPGIPAEHRDTVFDRFTRLDHARTRDTGGCGLGLAIARDIATAHAGTLVVAPPQVPARGACLQLVLPRAACPGSPAGRP